MAIAERVIYTVLIRFGWPGMVDDDGYKAGEPLGSLRYFTPDWIAR